MDARNFDFSDEAPEETGRDGWCYDTSRDTVEKLDRTVLVAVLLNGKPSVITASFLNGRWRSSSWVFKMHPFAWRELPEPPPIPSGWEESNG